ncbi:MAG: type II secretion system F family protein [Actinomycetes bacterium]
MSRATWGAILGLAMGAGLLLVGSWIRARRPMTVLERIGPFVGSVTGVPTGVGERATTATAWSTLWLLVGPVLDFRSGRPRPGGVGAAERQWLRHLAWAAVGAAVGGAIALATSHDGTAGLGVVLLGALGAAAGWLGSDRRDAQLQRRRRRRIERQLPGVAELMAFAVAAGESPVAALERVANTAQGDLADELDGVVSDVRSGAPFDIAVAAMGRRVASVPVQRFVDGLVIALERGTPIADVLRAQAADCRADEHRRLLELAGRKDVLMLVPVVFLILPVVVLVALFPGIQSLRLVVT